MFFKNNLNLLKIHTENIYKVYDFSRTHIKIIQGRELELGRDETNWPDYWPSTVEADGYIETNNILMTTSVYVEFFHNKKAFLRGKNAQNAHYNFVLLWVNEL